MIKDEECPKCGGEGWITVRRNAHGLHGLFEEDCPDCKGTGAVQIDLNEEADDD